jgi:hypothetical protein
VPGQTTTQSSPDGATSDPDARQVEELARRLEANRTQVLDASASDLEGRGTRLYWMTHGGISPTLHSRDTGASSNASVDYQFGIGSGDDANVRVSSDMVVTAGRESSGIVYRAYDATMPNLAFGSATFPVPPDGQKWWAYAVHGLNAYVVAPPADAQTGHTVWRFAAPGQPASLFTLEEVGISPGVVLDVGVEGNTMVLVEGGRLWSIDLTSKRATALRNKMELAGAVSIEGDGIVWEEADGLRFFSRVTGETRDLSAEIASASYRLNETFASSHRFSAATTQRNFTRSGDWIVYTASLGIFAYNLATRAIAPILLEIAQPGEARVSYRYPLALSDGRLFVVGLTSASGVVGADGPVYEVDLNAAVAETR